MIEQTDLVVNKWEYRPPANGIADAEKLTSFLSFDVMKKRAADKKGIACRFTCVFMYDHAPILEYVGEDSYVIDLQDIIDMHELVTMVRNSYTKFKERFDLRRLGTVLQDKALVAFDEKLYDLRPVLELLK